MTTRATKSAGRQSGTQLPGARVAVPEDVRQAIKSLVAAHGKWRTVDALECSQFTMEDAIAPGGRLRPATLASLSARLGPATEKLKLVTGGTS